MLAGAAFALFALAVQASDEPWFGAPIPGSGLEVPYGTDPQQTGDLFLPAKVTSETPFVLNIHGGGWSAMSRKDAAGVSAFLVEMGCAVYSIDYRLASKENPWRRLLESRRVHSARQTCRDIAGEPKTNLD